MARNSGRRQCGAAPPSGAPSEQEIIEGLKPLCICRGVRTAAVLRLIRDGHTTVEELRRATGAGSGSCKGERCLPRLRELLEREIARQRTG